MKALLTLCGGLIASALTLHAHPVLQDAMWVQFDAAGARVAVDVSWKEVCLVQGVSGDQWSAQSDYILQHLVFSSNDRALTGSVVRITPPAQSGEAERTFCRYELVYPWNGAPPERVTIDNEMLSDRLYAAGTPWNVSYVIRVKRAGAEAVTSWFLSYRAAATIPTGLQVTHPATSSDQNLRIFCDYLWHGVEHILTGYDHLLFIFALMIATRSFWEMVRVIAAFTLAHSLTLALCVCGIFRLPAFVVEPLIALSIIFIALENLFWPQNARSQFRLAIAFGFGLVHGLGFGGGLLDAMNGLPALGLWIALAAFSLGVEIGHQAVVVPLFGMLALSRRRMPDGFRDGLLRYGSSAISCGGAYFLFVALREQVFIR